MDFHGNISVFYELLFSMSLNLTLGIRITRKSDILKRTTDENTRGRHKLIIFLCAG